MAEFQRQGCLSVATVKKRFGGWNRAIEAAGLRPVPQGGEGNAVKFSDEDLAAEFLRVCEELKKIPTVYEFAGASNVSTDTYRKRFGSWRAAVTRCLGSQPNVATPNQIVQVSRKVLAPSRGGQMPKPVPETDKPGRVFGPPLDFRELRHEPVNEQGVVPLFGMVAKDLGFLVDAVGTGYPDCRAKRRCRGGYYAEVDVEFEFRSSSFRDYGHDPQRCDLIVCGIHDWPQCPIDVLELRSEIKQLKASM